MHKLVGTGRICSSLLSLCLYEHQVHGHKKDRLKKLKIWCSRCEDEDKRIHGMKRRVMQIFWEWVSTKGTELGGN